MCTSAVDPTEPPLQSVPGLFLQWKSDGRLKLACHLHLYSRLKMRMSLRQLTYTSSFSGA
jgi:hypothetical protein